MQQATPIMDTLNRDELRYLEDFENIALDPGEFDHRAHVYLTWLYLRRGDTEEEVLQTAGGGLRAFAAHYGLHDKYSQTITRALVTLITVAYRRDPQPDFDAFLQRHPELVADFRQLLAAYYSGERLFSDAARHAFVAPDLAPLPAA